MARKPLASRGDMVSDRAVWAFQLAEYRLRHYAAYDKWSADDKLRFCLNRAFEAATGAPKQEGRKWPRGTNKKPVQEAE